jgi:hypothetical protein
MRTNQLLPFGALLAVLMVGCGVKRQQPEALTIQENVTLVASDADAAEWIGIAAEKGQGEPVLFEKVLELKLPLPRGGSVGTRLQLRTGEPLPSVLVYRGTNHWAEDNEFVGEFRITEWPRPNENYLSARVGFEVTEQQSLLMWLRDPGPDRKGVANVEHSRPISIERVEAEGTEPSDAPNDGPASSDEDSVAAGEGRHR